MTFQQIPVQLAGPSTPNQSKPLGAQESNNVYPVVDPQNKEQFTLRSMWGARQLSSVSGAPRGMFVMTGVLYRVAGTTLYSVSSDFSHTPIGTIAGSKRCIFATNGVQLIIVSDGMVYEYSLTSGLVAVTDADIVGAVAVDYLNNQFIYTKPNQTFVISDVGNGAQASGLNSAQAESQPDELVRAFVRNQVIVMYGSEGQESWYNTETGNPPVQRIEQQISRFGLAGLHAITENDSYVYWLGDDFGIYRASSAGAIERISSISLSAKIQEYDDVSNCEAYQFTISGLRFVMFRFVDQGVTWCINESLGVDGWFQLSSGVKFEQYPYTSPTEVYNRLLVEGQSGELLELRDDVYTNKGAILNRRRTLAPISSDILRAKNKEIRVNRLELLVETGVGLLDDQGDDPIIQLEASTDGGRTWRELSWIKIGRLGDFKQRVKADFGGITCYECVFRMTCTDPIALNLYAGAASIKLTGKK